MVAVVPSAPPPPDDSTEETAHGLFKAPNAANDAQSALVARPERHPEVTAPLSEDALRRLIELRAHSRGLWSDSGDKIPAVTTQPRVEKLPKAVLGVSSLNPPTQPRAAANLTPSAASARPEPSVVSKRPEITIDSDAPTSPPPEVHENTDAPWVSERPTDVRKSLRALSQEPTPEVDRRATPLVARPEEPSIADAPAAQAGGEELSDRVLEQAAQQSALEAARRSGMQRALAVLVGCVVLIGLGFVFGLWPTPWSSPRTATTNEVKAPAAEQRAAAPAEPPMAAAPQPQAQPAAAATPPQPAAAPAQPQPSAAAPAQAAAAPQPTAAPSPAEPEPSAQPDTPSVAVHAAPPIPANVPDGLRAARGYLRAKDPVSAEAILRPMVEQNPEDHHIAELLVQALIDEKRGSEAAALCQRIIKKRPKRALYRVLLGDALRVSGAITAANAAWHEALELEPDNKEALKRLNQP